MAGELKILMVASEASPYAQTGGLADVIGALPDALARLGHQVSVALPFYRDISQRAGDLGLTEKPMTLPVGNDQAQIYLHQPDKTKNHSLVFIGNDELYDRENLYGDQTGDYPDNDRRFSFFARAALEACKRLNFRPDIIHCHDWQAGLAPVYLKTDYQEDPVFRNTASVFSIHNLGYQGLFPHESLGIAGLRYDKVFHIDGVEFYGQISFLKGGINYSEIVSTVSPRYAREIQTSEYGCGMEGVLSSRKDAVFGILNGVDYEQWNPQTDPALAAPFSLEDLRGKSACKKALLAELGLPDSLLEQPVIGIVSRLAQQKGLDILAEAFQRLMKKQVGFILLGSGERELEEQFGLFAEHYRQKTAVRLTWNPDLARRIYAGCDFILIPSRYEPCGLTQMYAMRYGTVPIVRATGGLFDTVEPWNARRASGTGFLFAETSTEALLAAVETALKTYRQPKQMAALTKNIMTADFSWDQSAKRYEELYQTALFRLP